MTKYIFLINHNITETLVYMWRLTRYWGCKDRIHKEKQVGKVGWNQMLEEQGLNIKKVNKKQSLLVSGPSDDLN